MSRQQPRYAGLLPASQRSFGPQPPLGANRALGLRAYFQQQSMRAAARSSQLQPAAQPQAAPQLQPQVTQLYQSQSQQYSQPETYASSQEAAYAHDLPMSQPPQQYSETQDPQYFSYSQPQVLSYSQPDAIPAYSTAQANQGTLGRTPLHPSASSQQLCSQQVIQRPPHQQQQQQQPGYGAGVQYIARQASTPPRFNEGATILPQVSAQQRASLLPPVTAASQSSAGLTVSPSPFAASQQGPQQPIAASHQLLPPDSQVPADGLLISYPPPSSVAPTVSATTTELAATAARLLGDISAMPAAAASTQELLEKATAQQSMLSQLQDTIIAMQEAGTLQSHKLEALESLCSNLSDSLSQFAESTGARRGDAVELLETMESRFKRILAAQSSRQRSLLLSTEQALVKSITQQAQTQAETLNGHVACLSDMLQSTLTEHNNHMVAQQRGAIRAALIEQGQQQRDGLAEMLTEAWERQAEQQSSFLAASLAEHSAQQLQALKAVRADQQVFLISVQQLAAAEQPLPRHISQPALPIAPVAGPPAAQLLGNSPLAAHPTPSSQLSDGSDQNRGRHRGPGTITAAFTQQKHPPNNPTAGIHAEEGSGSPSINLRRDRASVLVTYSRTNRRLAQSGKAGEVVGPEHKVEGAKRGRLQVGLTAGDERAALNPEGTLEGSMRKRQRMQEADAASALASLAEGAGPKAAQDLRSVQLGVEGLAAGTRGAHGQLNTSKVASVKEPVAPSGSAPAIRRESTRPGMVPRSSRQPQQRGGCADAGVAKHKALPSTPAPVVGAGSRQGAAAGTRKAQALELANVLAAIQDEEMGGFGPLGIFCSTATPEDDPKGIRATHFTGQQQQPGSGRALRSLPVQEVVNLGEIERQVREKMDRHRERRMRKAVQREE